MDSLIEENEFIEDWGQALHFLIEKYTEHSVEDKIQSEIKDVKQIQKEIQTKQTEVRKDITDLIQNYLYFDKYNDKIDLQIEKMSHKNGKEYDKQIEEIESLQRRIYCHTKRILLRLKENEKEKTIWELPISSNDEK